MLRSSCRNIALINLKIFEITLTPIHARFTTLLILFGTLLVVLRLARIQSPVNRQSAPTPARPLPWFAPVPTPNSQQNPAHWVTLGAKLQPRRCCSMPYTALTPRGVQGQLLLCNLCPGSRSPLLMTPPCRASCKPTNPCGRCALPTGCYWGSSSVHCTPHPVWFPLLCSACLGSSWLCATGWLASSSVFGTPNLGITPSPCVLDTGGL